MFILVLNKYFNKKNQNINYSKPINLVILSIKISFYVPIILSSYFYLLFILIITI